MSQELRDGIQQFADSTRDFKDTVLTWSRAKIDVIDIEEAIAIVKNTNETDVLDDLNRKLERAKTTVRRTEFDIGEVIDRIAPEWKKLA